jgi:SpoIID/LytB domain protein
MVLHGHGVGMSGCGAEGQARQGKKYAEILKYYYPGTRITTRN